MKSAIKILLLSVFFLLPLLAFAFENEPDGFRGIKWGTDLNEMWEMTLIKYNGAEQIYIRERDELSIGGATLKELKYMAYKHKLLGVWIAFDGYMNFTKLKDTLSQEYGNPQKPNTYTDEYYWFGANVLIGLRYDKIAKKGNINYFYKPIFERRKRDIKNEAKKGATDLNKPLKEVQEIR